MFSIFQHILRQRVHFKIIVFDLKTTYLGSSNLIGLGMKAVNTGNLDSGVLSSNRNFVKTPSNNSTASGRAPAARAAKDKRSAGTRLK
ncbi:hypothetical protein GWP43_07510 [Treponema vincentii]|uniref:PLD phosphodiesterase domain-containing protein n=1 Tax=Treponema vincentii TaxID=69710 RepID=A0A6P1Y0L8_9SPIR|nr:hypothetical protein [Treponema vincentii]QHX43318.1 hypothetical protein GWP43_07510 [Treponema vincentii]